MKKIELVLKDKYDINLLNMAINNMQFQAMRINKQADLEKHKEWAEETDDEIKRLINIKKQLMNYMR